jgi:peptide chain release factor subunit 1
MVDTTALTVEGEDRHIEVWKIKKLIQKLDNVKGNGTSFVSLYIPAKENMNLVTSRLTQELAQA